MARNSIAYKKDTKAAAMRRERSPSKARGSRAEVMHGTAKKTSGGLTSRQLKYNNSGRIVSRSKSSSAAKSFGSVKAAFKEGAAKPFRKKRSRKGSKKKRSRKKRSKKTSKKRSRKKRSRMGA
jgi:hypothetical protein